MDTRISPQKAVAILKKEKAMDQKYKLDKYLMWGVLLKSGARLYKVQTGYYILSGYAQDGSDVRCYC